jgi:hypothetical protein
MPTMRIASQTQKKSHMTLHYLTIRGIFGMTAENGPNDTEKQSFRPTLILTAKQSATHGQIYDSIYFPYMGVCTGSAAFMLDTMVEPGFRSING